MIAEARTWIRTPFLWEACIRGVGVDCGRFLAASFNGAGVKKIDIDAFPRFPASWFLHKMEWEASPFLDQLTRFAVEYDPLLKRPEPADLVVCKLGRDWAHSALVISWPHVIACLNGFCVTEYRNIYAASQFGHREMKFLDPFHPEAGGNV